MPSKRTRSRASFPMKKKPDPASAAAEHIDLALNYETWHLADPANKDCLKKALTHRAEADQELTGAEAKEVENRLLNLLAMVSDAIAAGDTETVSTVYAKLGEFDVSQSVQQQMKDAIAAELRHNRDSFEKAIAIRKAAESVFAKFSQSPAYVVLHSQNLVYLAADFFAVGDSKAGTGAIEKAIQYNLRSMPLLVPSAPVLEEAGDYLSKSGDSSQAQGLYSKAKDRFVQGQQLKDAARIEKKIAALRKD